MTLEIASTIEAAKLAIARSRGQGHTISLVPTMGALHAGHASLLATARRETEFVAVSIFVNPKQFGPNEDLSRYPRPWQQDLELCAREGVDLVFAPEATTIYPEGFRTFVEASGLQDVLCGASRPGHFRGVATVVVKLFNIVQPDIAYFGQKDAQQVLILRRMVQDLDVPVRLRVCPIVREADGLALSSRNRYLDPESRRQATVLHLALEEARRRIESGERDPTRVRNAMTVRIHTAPGAEIDYIAVVHAETLRPIERLAGSVLIALAVKIGATRLIDNIALTIDGGP